MPYVTKDGSGNIVGIFANQQYENQEFQEVAALWVNPVPQQAKMRQARLALLADGCLAQVNQAVASMTGTAGEAARIDWEFAENVERNNPLVTTVLPALGKSNAQIDQLFITAATL